MITRVRLGTARCDRHVLPIKDYTRDSTRNCDEIVPSAKMFQADKFTNPNVGNASLVPKRHYSPCNHNRDVYRT